MPKVRVSSQFIMLVFGIPYTKNVPYIKEMERSDPLILGTLGILEHFRHFEVYPGQVLETNQTRIRIISSFLVKVNYAGF